MKLLIADDDMQIREGIRLGIRWNELGITDVLTAANGAEAFELFLKAGPDIVIADIRMPGMDGLELFRRIKEKRSGTKVIIISAYSDFSYLKKAIQYGAVDYELKPIKVKSLIKLIRKTMEEIVKERTTENQFIKYRNSYKPKFIEDLLSGRITDRNIILEGFSQYFNFDMKGVFVCIVLEIDSYCTLVSSKPEKEKEEIFSFIKEYIQGNLLESAGGLIIDVKQNLFLITYKTEDSSLHNIHSRYEIKRLACGLNERLSSIDGSSVSFGISNYGNVAGIYEMYGQSLEALQYKLYTGRKSVNFFIKNIDRDSHDIISIINENEIKGSIANLDVENACEAIYDMFEQVKHKQCHVKKDIIRFCMDFVNLLIRTLKASAMDVDGLLKDHSFNPSEIPEYDIIEDYRDWVLNAYRAIIGEMGDYKGVRNPTILKAVDFVKKNYNKDLSVMEMAKHVEKTPNYFSHIFKKDMGISFSEYLNKVRVDKAKELIRNTNLLISEIAEMVGYQDYSYFSQIFRKTMGIAPSDLRRGE